MFTSHIAFVFLAYLFAFLAIPLSINNVNDDGISYFDKSMKCLNLD